MEDQLSDNVVTRISQLHELAGNIYEWLGNNVPCSARELLEYALEPDVAQGWGIPIDELSDWDKRILLSKLMRLNGEEMVTL